MTWRWWCVFCLLAGSAPGQVPDDVAGGIGSMSVAWTLSGLTPKATVMAYESDRGPELLVAGPRAATEPARLGDLTLVSPDGHARRRLATDSGLTGWPAMVGRVAVVCEKSGGLTLFTLTRAGLESTPRHIAADGAGLLGPVCLGRTTLFAAGSRLVAVSDLFEERWHADLPAVASVPLATDSERAFAGDAGGLTALALSNGRRVWRTPLDSPPRTALVVTEGMVIVGLADGSLRAFDVEDGSPQWRHDLAPADFAPLPAVAGPWVFVTVADGRLLAFDATSGEPAWSAQRSGPLTSPIVARGHVLVGTGDGVIAAVSIADPAKGLIAAAVDADKRPARLSGVPCLLGDRLYAVSDEGLLVAFDLSGATGPMEWPVPGGTAQRCGRSLPADELPAPLGPRPEPAPDDDDDQTGN